MTSSWKELFVEHDWGQGGNQSKNKEHNRSADEEAELGLQHFCGYKKQLLTNRSFKGFLSIADAKLSCFIKDMYDERGKKTQKKDGKKKDRTVILLKISSYSFKFATES